MLLYFDIFQYPLKGSELRLSVNNHSNEEDLFVDLIEMGIIEQQNGLYFLKGKNYTKRISEQTKSELFYKKAKTYSRLINRFPFVRGVYVSGSLSKEWSDDTTDVDYFLITSPERLWLCRTLLILFKKIFLFNSRKYFCLNYFIDTANLNIGEKNIFTATEISFLKPMVNEKLFHEFLNENKWVKQYYSSSATFNTDVINNSSGGGVKRFIEILLAGKIGEKLDIWCMKRTLKFWKKKFPEMKIADFEINFKSDRTISKHHPSGFQKRVLESLDLRLNEFEKSTGISLR